MRFLAALLVIVALVGCEPTDRAKPTSVPDGSTKITEAHTGGSWKATGGPKCRWWIQSGKKGGRVTNSGNTQGPIGKRVQKKGRAADQSQAVIFEEKNIGQYFKSDKCTIDALTGARKGWTK